MGSCSSGGRRLGRHSRRSAAPSWRSGGAVRGTYTFIVTARDGRGGTASDSINLTITPTKEVVLWASNAPWEAIGNWTMVDDPTAAGASRAYDPNAGAPKVNAPVPQPASRFALSFIADPTQTCKLWVRLKADGDRYFNDSVWVQLSGSTDAAGNPVYRIGSSSGLPINLEECANGGLSGWGWEDDGWGAVNRNGVTLRFPAGGLQVIQFSDPRGRRVDRSGRAVVGEVPDRAPGLREKRRDDSDVDVPSGRVRWAAFCIGDFGLTIGD
jgi:hypothetical protein